MTSIGHTMSIMLVSHNLYSKNLIKFSFFWIIYWRDKLILSKLVLRVLVLVSNFVLESRGSLFLLRLFFFYSQLFLVFHQKCECGHRIQLVHLMLLNFFFLLFNANLDFTSSWAFLVFFILLVSFTFLCFKVSETSNSSLYAS